MIISPNLSCTTKLAFSNIVKDDLGQSFEWDNSGCCFFISTSLMLFLFRRYFKEFGWVNKNLMTTTDGQWFEPITLRSWYSISGLNELCTGLIKVHISIASAFQVRVFITSKHVVWCPDHNHANHCIQSYLTKVTITTLDIRYIIFFSL